MFAVVGLCIALIAWLVRYSGTVTPEPPLESLDGAVIFVNGQRHSCGTPCYIKVGPGQHDVRVTHPSGEYRDAHRTVEVSWGVASFRAIENLHESEPIQLRRIDDGPGHAGPSSRGAGWGA